ncbi:mucin-19-like [Hydra vulgaris]|uniref:Mucin-19-like n=1 Tax=Hydra vulgaris TaxID=6087 RepID=A0ABM4C580_HYDVU
MSTPYAEHPIYVEVIQYSDNYDYDDSAIERRPIDGREIWLDLQTIPQTPPLSAPYPGGPIIGNTRGITGVQLTSVSPYKYASLSGHFVDMIPANHANGSYKPTLKDVTGRVIPYDPTVWIADGLLGVIVFKYKTPQELGYIPPLTIDYWRYTGAFASGNSSSVDGINLAPGAHIFKQKISSNQFEFRTLLVGTNVSLQESATGITINVESGITGLTSTSTTGAEINTNTFDGSHAVLRRIVGSNGLTVTQNTNDITIDNTLTGANLGTGSSVLSAKSGANLQFRSLTAGANLTLTQNENDIVTAPNGLLTTLANIGTGAQIFNNITGTSANIRSILSASGLSVTQNASTITIDNTLTGTNLGAGSQLFASKSGSNLQFRSLTADTGIELTQNTNDIMISSTLVDLANLDNGVQIFEGIFNKVARLRSLFGTANGLTVDQTSTSITIDNTLTGTNLGSGSQIFKAKSAANLQFRSLTAGGGIILTQNANDIIISTTDSGSSSTIVTTLANLGTGAQIFIDILETTANIRSLLGSANGLTVTQNASTITIDNTLTGANLGAGSQLFASKSGSNLQFRSLTAGTGIALTQNANDIIIATSIANLGTGAQIFDIVTANLRSIIGSAGITVTQDTNTITFDNTLTGVNLGTGPSIFSAKSGSNLQFRSLTAGTNISLTQNANDISIAASGILTAVANLGTGAQIFDAVVGTTINLRSILGTANGLTVTQNASTITIDNTLTGANLGAGSLIFSAKSGANLQFRSLTAGTGIALTQNANDIVIASTVTSSLSAIANLGAGAQIFDAVTGTTANFRSILGSANGLTVTQNASTITIDNTLTGANLGTGSQVFSAKTTSTLQFRTLTAGSNISLTQSASDITIAASGLLTSLANLGAGAQIFDSITGTSAILRSILGTVNGLTVTQNTSSITIDNTLTGVNLGAGSQLFASKSGSNLQFRSLTAGTGIALTQNTNDIVIAMTSSPITSLANIGTGSSIFDVISGTIANLRTLLGSSNGLSVTQNTSTITIDNTLTGTNLGTSTPIFSAKSGATLQFRSITAGTGISVTQNTNDITIATSGILTTLVNLGTGAQIFDAVTGTSANVRSLVGTTNGLTVTQSALSITIDNTLTGTNLGAGSQLFASKSGALLQFRTLTAGTGIALTQNTNDITIATIGVLTSVANLGAGAQIFDAITGTTANVRSLVGTTNGLTVTQNASTITIDNTLTGANLGTGSQLFISKNTSSLQFRSLTAGTGITLTQNANDIAIAASGVLTSLANIGAGAQIFDAVTGTSANVRSLIGSANGIALTQNTTTITIDNTLTGTNLGSGSGTIFSAKNGSTLQFNSIAGTGNGLTVSVPTAGLIVIDNTLTGANLGAGSQLFSAKNGANLQFRSLTAGTGIALAQNINDIVISIASVPLSSITNLGTGAQVFETISNSIANLRSFVGTVNGLTVTQGATAITIDNTLTGANLGAGSQLFSAKNGAQLQFRSLTAGTGITLTQNVNDIVIALASASSLTTLTNLGTGAQIFDAVTGTSANVRSILGTANGLTVAQGSASITIDNTLTGANLGTGISLFSAKSGASLQFNTISGTANGLTISAPSVAGVITIDNTLTGANLGAGSQLFSAKVGAALQFRTLTAGAGVTLTQNANDIIIAAASSVSLSTLSNLGAGAQIFDTVTGTTANLHSLVGSANGLTVTQGTTAITIDNTLTGANLGTGSSVFSAKSVANLQFRSLSAGTGIILTQNANDIVIATSALTSLANLDTGAQIFATTGGTTANLHSLLGTINGLTVTQNATNITIDNTLTGANLGTGGSAIFSAKTGAQLQFNSLAGTANGLTVSAPTAGLITIDNTLTGASLGGTAAVFANKTGALINLRGITAGTNVTVTQNVNDISVAVAGGAAVANLTSWRFTDEKANATNAGASVAGTQTRTLTTALSSGPNVANVTLATNLLTIQPGRYYVTASAPVINGGLNRISLVNNTTNAIILNGTNNYSTGATLATRSFISGVIAPTTTIVCRLSHYIQTAQATNGLGAAVGAGVGTFEVYAEVSITQIGV